MSQVLDRIHNEACAENERWLNEIRLLPSDQIISNALAIIIREEILALLEEEDNFLDSAIAILDNMEPEDRLDQLYEAWVHCDLNIHETINDMLDDLPNYLRY